MEDESFVHDTALPTHRLHSLTVALTQDVQGHSYGKHGCRQDIAALSFCGLCSFFFLFCTHAGSQAPLAFTYARFLLSVGRNILYCENRSARSRTRSPSLRWFVAVFSPWLCVCFHLLSDTCSFGNQHRKSVP